MIIALVFKEGECRLEIWRNVHEVQFTGNMLELSVKGEVEFVKRPIKDIERYLILEEKI